MFLKIRYFHAIPCFFSIINVDSDECGSFQTRGFLGNPQAELSDWLSCFPKVKGRASDLLVIKKKGRVMRATRYAAVREYQPCVFVCVRGRVLIVMATTTDLCEDEDGEGALRCIQDSGVFLKTDFTL